MIERNDQQEAIDNKIKQDGGDIFDHVIFYLFGVKNNLRDCTELSVDSQEQYTGIKRI
jgi:hypothetical protein